MKSQGDESLFPFRPEHAGYLLNCKRQNVGTILKGYADLGASSGVIHYSNVAYVMAEARQLVELLPEQAREKYRWLRLYCHLCVHARPLDNDLVLYQLLDDIADAFEKAMTDGGQSVNDIFYRVIPSTLSPLKLRGELRSIFNEFGIPASFLEDDQAWSCFVDGLSYNIAWKRIEISPTILADEIEAMGGLVEVTPVLSEPTKQEVPDTKNRRARLYFRRMAKLVGFPRGVPVSLQLAPREYLLAITKGPSDEKAWSTLEQTLMASFPTKLCWLVGVPEGQIFAPFSETGELPGMSIGS